MLRNAVTVRLDAVQRRGSTLGGTYRLLFGQFALRLLETALLTRQFLLEDALAIRVACLLRVLLNLGEARRRRIGRRACRLSGCRDRRILGYDHRLAALVDLGIRDQHATVRIRAPIDSLCRYRLGKHNKKGSKG